MIRVVGGGNKVYENRVLQSVDAEDMRDAVAASLISGASLQPYLQCQGCKLEAAHPLLRGPLDGWGYCLDCAELRSYQKRMR